MAEYIEREALIAEFKRLTLGENSLIERLFADGVYAVLETFPAADVVEVVHGEWVEHEWAEEENGLLISNFECSVCRNWERKKSDYCPNCGAKMDGWRYT